MSDGDETGKKVPAWLLRGAPEYQLAVGIHEVQEYMVAPGILDVPLTPRHCARVILWRDQFVPLFDLRHLLDPDLTSSDVVVPSSGVIVLAYQREPGLALEYLALCLYAEPEKVLVDDSTVAAWPGDYPPALRGLARSLFTHDDQLVSVLELAALASARYLNFLVLNGFTD